MNTVQYIITIVAIIVTAAFVTLFLNSADITVQVNALQDQSDKSSKTLNVLSRVVTNIDNKVASLLTAQEKAAEAETETKDAPIVFEEGNALTINDDAEDDDDDDIDYSEELNLLIAKAKQQKAIELNRKAARKALAVKAKCFKRTLKTISKFFTTTKMSFGSWTPTKELKEGRCRKLILTRDGEQEITLFESEMYSLFEREIDNYTFTLESTDETLVFVLQTAEERARAIFAEKQAKRVKTLASRQKALLLKIADLEEEKDNLPTYDQSRTIIQLVKDGKKMWKAGLKIRAKKAWKEALEMGPTPRQAKTIKRYLNL